MCAVTGMTTLASVTPNILSDAHMKRINRIYKTADENNMRLGIANYDKNANPELFVSDDGKECREYNWEKAYDGARVRLNWTE